MLRLRPFFLLVVSILLVGLTAGCGSSSSPPVVRQLDDLRQVAATSRQAASARFELDVRQSLGSQSFGISAEGGFDSAAKRAQLSFDMSSLASIFGAFTGGKAPEQLGDPSAWKLDAIQDGTVVYVHFPLLAGQLPDGKTWIKGDLEQLAREHGASLSQLGSVASTDPRSALDALKALTGTLETVGREDVRGVETTRYRATIDPAKLKDAIGQQAGADLLGSFDKMLATAGLSSIPVDIWIDDHDLLRRYEMQLEMSPAGLGGTAKTSLRLDLFDYGAPLEVSLPAPGEVADVSELQQAP